MRGERKRRNSSLLLSPDFEKAAYMDFLDRESIERHVAQLTERSRQVAVDFVLVELTAGLTRCRQVRQSQAMSEEKKAWHIAQARLALEVAESTMWKLGLTHPEFDQMMAPAERLRFELDGLKADS
jgi:EAL domain-containing protein (putative c-di-GMP-specific phosphodiesterase class I)